jgi:hypothetical protein
MSFVQFTRPDGSPVTINSDDVRQCAPVPASGPLMGPISEGTRISFKSGGHQDVRELLQEVQDRLNRG